MSLKNNNKSQRGFTIIETLMAISVLGIITTGIISLISLTVRAGGTVKQRITAYNIMQQKMEEVRNVRDTEYINGQPVDFSKTLKEGVYSVASSTSGPQIQEIAGQAPFGDNNAARKTFMDGNENLIEVLDAAEKTKYKALVEIQNIDPSKPDQKKVLVTVYWLDNKTARTLQGETVLTDWQRP